MVVFVTYYVYDLNSNFEPVPLTQIEAFLDMRCRTCNCTKKYGVAMILLIISRQNIKWLHQCFQQSDQNIYWFSKIRDLLLKINHYVIRWSFFNFWTGWDDREVSCFYLLVIHCICLRCTVSSQFGFTCILLIYIRPYFSPPSMPPRP